MTTNKKNKHIVVPQLGDYRALTTLGVPLVIGQIGVVLQNFADTLMIGHHTTVELAAAMGHRTKRINVDETKRERKV